MLHGHRRPLVFLIHIALQAMGLTLLLKLRQPLAVNLDAAGSGLGQGSFLKEPAHVVEQTGDAQEHMGRPAAVLMLEKGFRIDIALLRSPIQPVCTQRFVVLHTLAHEIQLAKHVLCVLITSLCSTLKALGHRGEIFLNIFPTVIFLAQPVGGEVVSDKVE